MTLAFHVNADAMPLKSEMMLGEGRDKSCFLSFLYASKEIAEERASGSRGQQRAEPRRGPDRSRPARKGSLLQYLTRRPPPPKTTHHQQIYNSENTSSQCGRSPEPYTCLSLIRRIPLPPLFITMKSMVMSHPSLAATALLIIPSIFLIHLSIVLLFPGGLRGIVSEKSQPFVSRQSDEGRVERKTPRLLI